MVNTKKLKGEKTPTEEENRDTNLAAANENINPMDSVEEEEEEDENYGDTRDFSTPLNSLEISLIELGELVNAREEEMREWTKALEKLESLHWKKRMEALDMIVTALEAYVEKVGEDSLEDSPQDVKEKEKKGNGVKRTVCTLDDNLNKPMSRSKKEKCDLCTCTTRNIGVVLLQAGLDLVTSVFLQIIHLIFECLKTANAKVRAVILKVQE
ncbi:hypothetical protein F2Q69_00035410 [Brassica cretica]|uniref:Uncharacterized protein n=1 Tax=Brassica cretica TaxID=69181 RepID=A0A8S9SGP6_BRACR|nr:hypothetical protein F2Q69_00035410 [Brassica cretica]